MKNRKTTIFGLLAAISGYFATAGTGKVQVIAQAIAGLSTFLLGNAAADIKKDNKNTMNRNKKIKAVRQITTIVLMMRRKKIAPD